MYKVLWNHLNQNLKKAPAPAVFLALLTVGWSVAGILAGLLVCLELQTELMVKLTVILCGIRRTDSRFLRWDLLSLPNGSSETFCGSCS